MGFSQYTKKDIQRTFKDLETSENGLSEKEITERLKKYGLNELKGKEVGPLDVFLRQFKSPFFLIFF